MKKLILSLFLALLSCQPAFAQVIPSIPYNLTNGSLADATQVMGNFNTIVSDTNANAATNGANTNITSLSGLTTPLANTYGGTALYTGGTTGGSANAQTLIAVVPSNFTLTAGNMVTGIAGFTNTTAMTLAVNGQTATDVRKLSTSGPTVLTGSEVHVGNSYLWYYDGTYLILLNPTPVALASTVVNGPASSTSGDIATFNGTGGNVIQDSGILPSSLVRTVKRQVFTSSGTYTPSTGMLYANIEVWGAGGGGGGGPSNAGFVAGGGGMGGYSEKMVSAATVGASQTVTIGAAGTAGTTAPSNGGVGGTTSVGSIAVAVGGAGGIAGNGANVLGGAGGLGSSGTGDITATGAPGGLGIGGGAGSEVSGSGGSGALGGAGTGQTYLANATGISAVVNSGAGGGGAAPDGNARAGGAGGSGYAVITEYNSQ